MTHPRNCYGNQMPLTEICMELHAGGSVAKRRAELIRFLEQTLADRRVPCSAFDRAVRALVEATLDEVRPW